MRTVIPILSICLATISVSASQLHAAEISRAQRIAAQLAVERVLWQHRVWPKQNPQPRPSPDQLIDVRLVEAAVDDTLRRAAALEQLFGVRLDGAAIQAELDRVAAATRDRALLRELFAALSNDPALIGEVLIRPALTERRLRAQLDQPFDQWWAAQRHRFVPIESPGSFAMSLPQLAEATDCTPGSWDMLPGHEIPDPRRRHTAVWTGTEMLIWGGETPDGVSLGLGSAYNPATDTWRAISTVGAPASRTRHTAIWTGSKMIVWGGAHAPGFVSFGDGGSYDPSTDSWTPIPVSSQVAARFGHTAVWTGTTMIVWGGLLFPPLTPPTNTGGVFDPASGAWAPTRTTGAPFARVDHTAVWTGTWMIVWGGGSGSTVLTPGAMYDPRGAGAWTPMNPTGAPLSRRDHAAVMVGTRMMVFGGNSGGVTNSTSYRDGGWFTPTAAGGTWAPLTTFGLTAEGSSFVTLTNVGDDVVLFGGRITASIPTNTASRYNLGSDSWFPISMHRPPSPRYQHTAVWTGTELIVWGGSATEGDDTGGRLDVGADRWSPTATRAQDFTRRSGAAGVWTGAEWLLWGGRSSTTIDTGVKYTPALDQWSSLEQNYAPQHRDSHTAVWTGDRMIIWGGRSALGPGGYLHLNSGGMYQPTGIGAWSSTADVNAPAPRGRHTATWTGTRMLIWGGEKGSLRFGDGGSFDPLSPGEIGTWDLFESSGAPSARSGATGVWTGSRWIVWGGRDASGVTNSGASYDPMAMTWQATSTIGAPAPREFHTAVWADDAMLVWGGWDGVTNYLGTGGSFHPNAATAWEPIVTTGAPAPRGSHTTIWTGREMIVWGGNSAEPLSDGASYQPSSGWTPLPSFTPLTPRATGHAVWTGESMLIGTGAPPSNGNAAYCVCNAAREILGLRFVDRETLAWNAAQHAVRFDLLRSPTPSDFVSNLTCVATDTAATSVADVAVPASATAFAYLVRGRNDCGTGVGTLGSRSDGTPRAASPCP